MGMVEREMAHSAELKGGNEQEIDHSVLKKFRSLLHIW